MTTTNMENVRTELVIFLRNSDILSTAQRGVTTISNVFTATGAQTVFTLSNSVARNIRYVSVDGAQKSAYVDYTPDYKVISSTVTFLAGMSGGELVDIGFDYSARLAEKIFPDYPEIQYLPSAIPRIGFEIIAQRSKPIGIGDTNWLSDALISIKVYDSNLKNIDNFITTIREKVKAAQLSFFHFPIVTISNAGPPLLHDIITKQQAGGKTRLSGKVFEKAIDLIAKFNYES